MQAGRYIDRLRTCDSVVVIGGGKLTSSRKSAGLWLMNPGAVGIEMAAEIKHRYPTKQVTLVHSRSALLSSEPVPTEFQYQVLQVAQLGGVNVMLKNRVLSVTEGLGNTKMIKLEDGNHLTADEVIWATSSAAPVTEFLPREALDEKGFVNVLPS